MSICDVLAPKTVQWLIDLLVNKNSDHVPEILRGESSLSTIRILSFTLLANFAIAGIGGVVWREGLARMTHLVAKDIRIKFWQALKRTNYAFFFARYSVGDLINRLSQDYNFTRFMHGFNIALTFDTAFFTVLGLAFMFFIDVELTLYCTLCFLIVPPFISRLARKEHALHIHAQRELSTLSDLISQAVATVKLQRSTGGEEFWQKKLNISAQEYAKRNYRVQKTGLHIFPFGAFPVICSYAILCSLGLQKILQQELSLGEFFALASYILLFQGHLYQLGDCISTWQMGLASYGRILEIIKNRVEKRKKTAEVDFRRPLLEIKSLTFSHKDRAVIKFFTLNLSERQWLGITGALGSGKTTILRCITGLLPVQDDRILIYGADINYLPNAMRSKLISYVPQKVFLFSTTIRENLSLNRTIDDNHLWQVLAIVQLREFIAGLPQKLDTKIGEWGVDLSGGQKQRLAIGRAILRKPKLLLFDDCFSAIDSITEKKIMQQVRVYLADTAIIWASHRTSSFSFCSKVITLTPDRIITTTPSM